VADALRTVLYIAVDDNTNNYGIENIEYFNYDKTQTVLQTVLNEVIISSRRLLLVL
jgi:hypothetical protein